MKIARLPSTRRKNLTTILILVIGLPILIFASYQVVNLISKAGGDVTPKNVIISNLTTSSVTISWTTEEKAQGSVVPVLNGNEKSPVIDKRGYSTRYTHYVEITDLEPDTSYDFLIVSNNSKYSDEGGKEFAFKTAPVTADAPTPNPIHGSVQGASGDDVVLYALYKDKSVYPVSTIMPSGGNWIVDLSTFRKISDKSLVITGSTENLVIIAVSQNGTGAVVEGVYSDLFDSNGKLKETNPLEISTKENIYTYFPPQAQLETYALNEEEPPPYVPPVVEEEPEEQEEQEEEPPVEEDLDREFQLRHDLNWIDMVKGGTTSVTGTTGEDSILITNLTDTGATILWVSDEKETGSVEYGTSVEELNEKAVDERDGLTNKGSYYVHSVNLSRLEPEKKIYFKVISGEEEFDNDGKYFSFTTFATLNSPPPFESITGTVDGIDGENEVAVVGYIKDNDETGSQGNSVKMSTVTDEDGKWILSIADSRTEDGVEYFEYTDEDTFVFDILATNNVDTKNESLKGISERDIELEVTASDNSGTKYTKIDLLDTYGILGVGSINIPIKSDTNTSPTNTVDGGSSTPQAGLFGNMVILIVLGIIPVVSFSYVLISSKNICKKGKNNMKSMIN